MTSVRPATAGDVEPLTRTFWRAFDQDPMMDWIIRADRQRSLGMQTFFRQCLSSLCLPYGMVLTSADCQGGALWVPSQYTNYSFRDQLGQLPNIIRAAGWVKLPRFIEFMQIIDRHHPPEPHFYLMFIAVDPNRQKQGLGTALMRPVLERCDREGMPAYLENSNPVNRPMYDRLGFQKTGEIPLGPGGPVIDAYWRAPRPPQAPAEPAQAVLEPAP